jgi:hypothetical protein
LIFEKAGQDAHPAFGRWRHEVGELAGLRRIDDEVGIAGEEVGDDPLPLLGLERADR